MSVIYSGEYVLNSPVTNTNSGGFVPFLQNAMTLNNYTKNVNASSMLLNSNYFAYLIPVDGFYSFNFISNITTSLQPNQTAVVSSILCTKVYNAINSTDPNFSSRTDITAVPYEQFYQSHEQDQIVNSTSSVASITVRQSGHVVQWFKANDILVPYTSCTTNSWTNNGKISNASQTGTDVLTRCSALLLQQTSSS